MNDFGVLVVSVLAVIGIAGICVWFLEPSAKTTDNPYEPKIFLRKRNDGTYFIQTRTHNRSHLSQDGLHTHHEFTWYTQEAGDTEEEAEKLFIVHKQQLDKQKVFKEGREWSTVKEYQ